MTASTTTIVHARWAESVDTRLRVLYSGTSSELLALSFQTSDYASQVEVFLTPKQMEKLTHDILTRWSGYQERALLKRTGDCSEVDPAFTLEDKVTGPAPEYTEEDVPAPEGYDDTVPELVGV